MKGRAEKKTANFNLYILYKSMTHNKILENSSYDSKVFITRKSAKYKI